MIVQWTQDSLSKLPQKAIQHIALALEHGNGERVLEDVAKDLMSGFKQIWLHTNDSNEFDFTIVTQIIEHPTKKICEIVYSGGEGMLVALDELKEIEDWARMNGCTDIHAVGRKYLSKSLASYGYTQRYITVGKAL
jgi:hypothetical protein